MKSKTSCFNVTIFKRNLTHFWPLALAYLAYLIVVIPARLWLNMSQQIYYEESSWDAQVYEFMYNALRRGLEPIPIFLFAAFIALAMFYYMYSSRSAHMIHALPVNRLELFVTNYISGLLFMLIPELITFVTTVLVCVAFQITCIQYILIWFLYTAGISVFAYSLAVFVAMFTGQAVAMPVYFVILNYLYVGCLYIVCSMIEAISYGIETFWEPGVSCILSPLYYLSNNVRARAIYDENYYRIIDIEIVGGKLVAIYLFAAVILAVVAYQLYKRRKMECVGDVVSIGIVKPIFRWGVALCGGMGGALIIPGLIVYQIQPTFWYIAGLIVVLGFVGFFFAEMLLRKSFRVFKKKRILEWIGFTVVAVFFVSLFNMDAFGIEGYVPQLEEIETAFVEMDFPVEIPEEEMQELLDIHQTIIDSKNEYLTAYKLGEGTCYTQIVYYLKDGTKVARHYSIPTQNMEDLDVNTPYGKIYEWETDVQNVRYEILGRNYDENQYVTYTVERYTEDGRLDQYLLTAEQQELLYAAIERDIEEGNFAPYVIYSMNYGMEAYYNSMYIQYFNQSGVYDNWTYYQTYGQEDVSMERGWQSELYITFGSECENVVETLEELDIINDTWRLYTYEEYAEKVGY